MPNIDWNVALTEANLTYLRGRLPVAARDTKATVTRLAALSGHKPTEGIWEPDLDDFGFVGRYKGIVFTLYGDYVMSGIKIGGHDGLDVDGLATELMAAL